MAALRLTRKWGVPLATAVSVPLFGPSVFADSGSKDPDRATSRMVRPSELPIYEEPEEVLDFEYHGRERSSLEEGVGAVRKEIEGLLEATRSTREKVVHICETGKAHTMATVDYITDEDNIIPRAGAITVGGLAGLVLGARKKGGLVKKVLYTSTGIAATASLCYPRHAYQISQQIYGDVKDYANIGYNFVAGVKPQSKVATPDEPSKESAVELKEPAVESSSDVETPPSTDSTAAPEAAPVTSEPEGGEVRSVLPQALPDEKLPAPLDSLAQQSSDVTMWGFRLTDKTTNASSVRPDVVPPAEPAVPEGFGSVSEADNKDVLETASDHVIVEESRKEATGSETITIPKAVESLAADVAEKVAEDIVEKAGEELVEKAAEVVTEVAQETEEEAKEVAEVARVVEEVSDKGESVVEVVEDVVEAADKAAHETPGMSVTALDVAKEVVEEVEKVVDTVHTLAEKVEEVAEEIAKEAEDIKTKALELVESEEKREEFIEKVIDYVKEELETESVEKVIDTVTDITEKVEEVAEDIKTKALELVESEEKREELLEKVIDYVKEELVPEPVQEVKEAVEAYVKEMAEIKTDEGAVVVEPELEIKELAEEQEPKPEEKEAGVIAPVEELPPVTETVEEHSEEPSPVAEGKETPSATAVIEPKVESEYQVPVRKESLFDKLISLFTKDDEETESRTSAPSEEAPSDKAEVPETEVIKEASTDKELKVKDTVEEAVLPVTDMIAEDIEKVGEVAVEKTAEVVDEISKEVEQEAEIVAEMAETVKEVGDEVTSALKVADEVAEAAVEAAQAVPSLPEIVIEKAEMAKEVVEEAEKVVDTITLVAEKVKEVSDEVKHEAATIEFKAAELIESEEKREEFIENVVDFVTEKLIDKVEIPKQETELVEEKKEVTVGESAEVGQDVVEEKLTEQPSVVETPDHSAVREETAEATKSTEEEVKEPKAEEVKPEEKEGLVDKLINLITKREDKVPTPDVVEEKAGTVEAVTATPEILSVVEEKAETVETVTATPEILSVVQDHADEKVPEEVVVEESKVSPDEVPVIEELKDVLVPVEEVKGQIAEESEAQVSKAGTVEEVKPKEKEGLVDKLINLFSKTDEKEVMPSVAEEKAEPGEKVKEVISADSNVVQEQVQELKQELVFPENDKEVHVPVAEELKEIIEVVVEHTVEEVKEATDKPLELVSEELKEKTAEEKEGLVDKLVNLFSKSQEKEVPPVAEEGKTEPSVEQERLIEDVSTDVIQEPAEEIKPDLLLVEEIKSELVEGEVSVEVPSDDKLKELITEDIKETSLVEVKEEVQESKPEKIESLEKEGLIDKLVSLFSKGDEEADSKTVTEEKAEPVDDKKEITSVESGDLEQEKSEVKEQEIPLAEKSEEVQAEGTPEVPVFEELEKPVIEAPVVQESTATIIKETDAEAQETTIKEEKVGLIDKLVNIFSSDDKVAVPVKDEIVAEPDATELKEEREESVGSEELVTVEKVEEEVPTEVMEVHVPVAEELKEIIEVAVEHTVEEVKEATDKPLELVSEELKEKTAEEKEGLVDKLVSLFSKSQDKEVAPVAEEGKTEPAVEQERLIEDVSTDVIQEPAEEIKPDLLLVEEIKPELVEGEVTVEVPSDDKLKELITEDIKETSLVEVKEPYAEEIQESKPEKIESIEKEGLIDKLVNLFSKGDEETESKAVTEEKAGPVDDKKEITSVESGDLEQEKSEGKEQEIPLAEKIEEVQAEGTVEVPVFEELEKPVIEAPAVQESTATIIKETDAEAQEATIKEEKVGLIDKLVNIFSSDDKVAVPVKDKIVVELKEEKEESVGSEDSLTVEKVEEEVPIEKKEVASDEIEDFVIIEKSDVPEGEKGAVPEPMAELPTSVEKEAVDKKGLIGRLADLFSKDEKKDVDVPIQEEAESELQSPLQPEITLEKETVTVSPEKIIEETVIEIAEKVKEDVVAQSTELVESVEKNEGLIDKLVSLISSSDEKQEVVVSAEPTSQSVEGSASPVGEAEKASDQADAVTEAAVDDAKVAETEVSLLPDIAKEDQVEKGGLFAKLGNLFTKDKEGDVPAVEAEKEPVSESILSKAEEEVKVEDIPVSEFVASDEIPAAASEEPVLEVKDKSLFSKLAELVSSNDKKPEELAAEESSDMLSQETVSEPSQEKPPEQLPEAEGDQRPSLVSSETEVKPTLFDRVANIFSKDNEPVPSGEPLTTAQEISSDSSKDLDSKTEKDEDDQLFVVVSKPSSPVHTGDPEDGGQQTVQSSGWLQGSWFRSSSSVKQEGKDVIIKVGTTEPEKDYGQSNPEDSDMYTTRS